MAEAVEVEEVYAAEITSGYCSRRRNRGALSNSGGGHVEDVLKRLGAVESCVGDMRAQLSAVSAQFPHLATKSDLSALETRIIKWNIATIVTSIGAAFSIAKFVH